MLEIDGSIHDPRAAQDKDFRKDERLRVAGYMIFRMRNADIWNDREAAVHIVGSTLGICPPEINQKRIWRRYGNRGGRRFKGLSDFGPVSVQPRKKSW